MEHVTLRMPSEIVRLLNEIAKARSITRSDFIRLCLLEKLAYLSYLPAAQKKAFGVSGVGSVNVPPTVKNEEVVRSQNE